MDGFGERLRARARGLGLSDAEVARRAGLGGRRYAHYVSNEREPDLATLVRIARALGTTPDDLLGIAEPGEGEPDPRRTRLEAAWHALDDPRRSLAADLVECLAFREGDEVGRSD